MLREVLTPTGLNSIAQGQRSATLGCKNRKHPDPEGVAQTRSSENGSLQAVSYNCGTPLGYDDDYFIFLSQGGATKASLGY